MRIRSIARTPINQCANCGYAQLPASEREYWDTPEKMSEDYWTLAKARYFQAALKLLGDTGDGRRIIDIGGGVGHFAELAIAEGWDAWSYDVSSAASEQARSRIGDRALDTLPDMTFDAATLWCVVAHVRDPASVIRQTRALLRPGGILWLTTPNWAFQKPYARARRIVRRPLDWYADDHIGHFGHGTVRQLLESQGFEGVSFHRVGITEHCAATKSAPRLIVLGKRAWSPLMFPLKLENELQVSAFAV